MTLMVLLVEDDLDLAATIHDFLDLEGISCDHASNGLAGLNLARAGRYDVLLLDIMLPRMDGLAVCTALREAGVDTPVLMLTARDTVADKVAGFRAGTDDYLVKPFALEELVVRVQALARRRSGQVRRLRVADLEIDIDQRRVWRDGRELQVSPTGWILLETLMRQSPRVVSRHQLAQAVWGDDPPDSNALKVHVHHLRQAIDRGFDRPLIETVPGHGFVVRGGRT